jgi:integrase
LQKRVPKDIQHKIGKKVIEVALNTDSLQEAAERKHAVLAKILADFARVRSQKLSPDQITSEAYAYYERRLEELKRDPADFNEIIRNEDGQPIGRNGDIALLNFPEMIEDGFYPVQIEKLAQKIASQKYGLELRPGDETLHTFAMALLRAEYDALCQYRAYRDDDTPPRLLISSPNPDAPLSAVGDTTKPVSAISAAGIRIEAASATYIEENTKQPNPIWEEQTRLQNETTLRFFKDYMRNAPLESVKKSDVSAFIKLYGSLDRDYGRKTKGKNTHFLTVVENHAARPGRELAPKTLKRHVGALIGMFDCAISNGTYEGGNPARGAYRIRRKNDGTDEPPRRDFSVAELKKLFSGHLFRRGFSDRVRPKKHTYDTTLAWLIPISLFTGMRLDEICGLRIEDIAEYVPENGGGDVMHYFSITPYEGRRLKTTASRRRVPVHSELIRLGLLDYKKHTAEGGHTYLFPALKRDTAGKKRTSYMTDKFLAYRRGEGVAGEDTVFHCFRNTAITALENALVPDNIIAQIVGHKKETIALNTYSGGIQAFRLTPFIEKIEYSGLDLSRLHRHEWPPKGQQKLKSNPAHRPSADAAE